jgi:hypothetical protein
MAKTKSGSPAKANTTVPTKIPSPTRKKDGFNKANKKAKASNPNHCEIKVLATLGDEELYFLLKPGNDGNVDAYAMHLKKDLDDGLSIQQDLCLVAGYPRRESKDNQRVALSHGKFVTNRKIQIIVKNMRS